MRFLLLIAYIFIEFYLIVEFIDEAGFLAFILEIIISALLGFGILASQFGSINDNLRNLMAFRLSLGSFLGRSIFRFIGGVLLIIPAILSDIFGVTFFIISLLFKAESQKSSHHFYSYSANFDFDAESRSNFAESSKFKTKQDDIIDVEVIEHKHLK